MLQRVHDALPLLLGTSLPPRLKVSPSKVSSLPAVDVWKSLHSSMHKSAAAGYALPAGAGMANRNVQQPDLAQLKAGPRECRPLEC